MGWAEEEMGGAELGDVRRSRRLVRLVERLAEQPSVSIPAACAGAAETKAAYRLLSHDAVGWDDILAPHLKSSLQRMQAEPVKTSCTWRPDRRNTVPSPNSGSALENQRWPGRKSAIRRFYREGKKERPGCPGRSVHHAASVLTR
jgi:hypothetical protein